MKVIIITLLMLFSINTRAQSCKEFMELVKSENSGTAYTSYTSSSISKVTFYEVSTNSTKLYFAIVCFKREYSINCNEYIYQVASDTKSNYSNNYYLSAGKAFGKYIAPYKNNLKCGPS